ncbi:MAG: hypothetical protein IPP93_10440 [Chitinophagaceae bacterium]|nr:hypothetical protein [Chitinophagaceae bacterium]
MKSPFRLQAILFLFALLAIAVNTQGQKDPKRNITQVKELPLLKAHITKEIEGQIIEIVKPVKEKIETLYKEDNTGTYTAYATDMQKLGEIKDVKERMAYAKNIQKKYYSFVKKTWDQAKIDEGYYQQKLKNLFPGNVKETIRFGEFLNFTMGSSFQKPIPPPPPPPGPANICVNANLMFRRG